jgi:hypothetical protein
MDWLYGEPTLDEMLSDPTVHAVMNSDGVDGKVLRDLLQHIDRTDRSAPSRCAAQAAA